MSACSADHREKRADLAMLTSPVWGNSVNACGGNNTATFGIDEFHRYFGLSLLIRKPQILFHQFYKSVNRQVVVNGNFCFRQAERQLIKPVAQGQYQLLNSFLPLLPGFLAGWNQT